MNVCEEICCPYHYRRVGKKGMLCTHEECQWTDEGPTDNLEEVIDHITNYERAEKK